MTKYHINDHGEAKPCSAKLKCRFGGDSGVENHFSNKEEAENAAQKLMEKKYGGMRSIKKNTAGDVLNKLSERGVSISKIESIQNHVFVKSHNINDSSIDVLDEKPSKDFLESIKKGALSYKNV